MNDRFQVPEPGTVNRRLTPTYSVWHTAGLDCFEGPFQSLADFRVFVFGQFVFDIGEGKVDDVMLACKAISPVTQSM